jgi:hypothetical protein
MTPLHKALKMQRFTRRVGTRVQTH